MAELLSSVPAYLPQDPENPDVHLDSSGNLPVERLAIDEEFDSPTPASDELSVIAVDPSGDGLPHWKRLSELALYLAVIHVPLTTAQGELIVLEDGGAIVATIPLAA